MLADVITFGPADIYDDVFALRCQQEALRLAVPPDGSAQAVADMVTEAIGGEHIIERKNVMGGFNVLLSSKMNLVHALDIAIAWRLMEYGCASDIRKQEYPEDFDMGKQIKRMQALRAYLNPDAIIAEMAERAELLRAFRSGPDEKPDGTLTATELPEGFHLNGKPMWGLRDGSGRWMQRDGLTVRYETETGAQDCLQSQQNGRMTFTDAPGVEQPIFPEVHYDRHKREDSAPKP